MKMLGLIFKSIKMLYISYFYTVPSESISHLKNIDGSLHIGLQLYNEMPS